MRTNFVISPKKVALVLVLIVAVLALASLAGQFLRYTYGIDRVVGKFNVDTENNIPTWFSTGLLLSAGLLLGIIAMIRRQAGGAFARHWSFLAFLLIYLSIDEAAQIHETALDFLMPILNIRFLHFWVIPVSVLVLVFLVAYLKFIAHLPSGTRRLFLLSGAVYVSGALVGETVGGIYAEMFTKRNFLYSLLATWEETFEMLGMVIFIYTLLTYLGAFAHPLQIQIRDAKPAGVFRRSPDDSQPEVAPEPSGEP